MLELLEKQMQLMDFPPAGRKLFVECRDPISLMIYYFLHRCTPEASSVWRFRCLVGVQDRLPLG
jgi:hypothetical protein